MGFDRNQYLKQVLDPAVKGVLDPDYFARYGLQPSERSQAVIDASIKDVQALWNTLKNNTRYRALIGQFQAEDAKACAILRDEAAREEYSRKVLEQRKTKADERLALLDAHIKMISDKGYYTPDQLKHLQDTFPDIAPDAIKQRIKVKERREAETGPVEEGLPSTVRKQIRQNLQALGQLTLYTFLKITPLAGDSEVHRAYDSVKKEWDVKPPGPTLESAQRLLGMARTHLWTEEGRRKYDQSCQYEAA